MHEESESMTEVSDIAEGCTTTVCSDKIQSRAVRQAHQMIGGPRPSKVACCMLEQHVRAHVLAVRNLFQTDAVQQWQVTPWKTRAVLKTMMTRES